MEKIKRTFGFIWHHPLAGQHVFRAMGRLLWWQLRTALRPGTLLRVQFIGQVKYYAYRGLTGVTGNIYTGLHEFGDMGFLLHFLRPDDVFYDIGANAGAYTLLAAGVCGAETIAIEASAASAALIEKNVMLNGLSNVSVVCAAAGANEGMVTFSKDQDTTNHVTSPEEAGSFATENVRVIPVDRLTGSKRPAMLKIDVEGFEPEVLKGMAETLPQLQLKCIVIELNGSCMRYGVRPETVHNTLLGHGFHAYGYDPFKRRLEPLASFGADNTIYCRDPDFVRRRIASAKKFKVMGEAI